MSVKDKTTIGSNFHIGIEGGGRKPNDEEEVWCYSTKLAEITTQEGLHSYH